MPRARMGTGVATMGCFAALGAVGCAAGVARPAVGDLEPTASQAVPTATLDEPTPADPADVLRQTVLPQSLFSFPSPDGKLRAEIRTYACTLVEAEQAYALDQHVIHGRSRERSCVADEQLQACGELGASGLGGLYWSPDGQRFYYTPAREGVPDGCGMWWAPPIAYVDVKTRVAQELRSGVMSPDGSLLAISQTSGIVLWHVNQGEIGLFAPGRPRSRARSVGMVTRQSCMGLSPGGWGLHAGRQDADCPSHTGIHANRSPARV